MNEVKLRELLTTEDYTAEILSYHHGALNRAKIDTALNASGYTTPLPRKVSFHLYKMNAQGVDDVFMVTWFPMATAYGIEKLTLKA